MTLIALQCLYVQLIVEGVSTSVVCDFMLGFPPNSQGLYKKILAFIDENDKRDFFFFVIFIKFVNTRVLGREFTHLAHESLMHFLCDPFINYRLFILMKIMLI